ncbi:MAG: hypothetical protein ACREV6_01295 [Clostridium sp.]|uniref:hypothetical protein n=1 Tax=Clostridium sp. TaxID=1506 RepID=UPI003D6C90E9
MKSIKEKFKYMDLSDDEINLFCSNLDKYTLCEYPSQDEINQCVNNLYEYVPKTKNKEQRFNKLIENLEFQISYINKIYFISSLLIFIITYVLAMNNIVNSYGALMFISPIPFVLGITEVFKGKENNMLELELSYKVSGRELILYRMMIIAVFNIFLNVFMTIMMCKDVISIRFIEINILWIVPFIWVNFICIILAEKIRSYYAVIAVISIWVILVVSIYSNTALTKTLISINTYVYVLTIIGGIYLLFMKIKRYKNCEIGSFSYKN